ncbi:DENN domain-containing protein 1C isoform X2 [Pleurodeles waltl]|uniref:DENN domain-containing protein 1C isoform X2 n=1 Tax=Pleurodeles waltl TaxID=8319 RepID=UPI003709AD30
MGCRIKENPDKIFDWFFEVTIPKSIDDDPKVVRQFPEEFTDQDSIQKFPKFCFPFDIDRVKESTVVQNFTFVLTDLDGNQRFGFCRLSVGYKACICILSYLPWFEVFYKLLNNIADHLAKDQFSDLGELLTSLYRHPVPQLNSAVSLEFLSYFIAPDSGGLPTIPESRNLTEFVLAVDVNNMLQLYASMLHERRILITSSKLSTLTACVHASTAMLYPMYWQNIYIPILPPHLLDYCCAPMPYLIGVHSSLMEHVRQRPLEDVVVLNVDSNTLETPFQDLESLPADVVSLLKLRLKKQSAVTGDGVARAFLRAQALLFGSYRDALICTPEEPITFCEESFLDHKSNPMKQFLQNAVHLQLFKEFIDGRLLKLNSGAGFCDVFEQEIDSCGLGSGHSNSYQLWVESLKKGGGALIHTVKNKTNPAMKNMYRKAKGQAKMGLKDLRIRLRPKDMTTNRLLRRGGSLRSDHFTDSSQPRTAHDCLQNRLPITQHFGQSRPKRPSKIDPLCEENSSWASESDVSTMTDDEPQAVEEMSELDDQFLDSGEIDLLGEIFDTLSTQASNEKGLLYGTQSLDFFSLEDSSFIKTIKSMNPPSDDSLNLTRRRDSEPFGSGHWYPDREPSLDHPLLSSDEFCISEEPEGVCTQTGQNAALHSLVVPLAATVPEWKCHSSKGSGMWDRGIDEQNKIDARADASIDTPCQMSAQGLSSDIKKPQRIEEGNGGTERDDQPKRCEENPKSPNIKLQPEEIPEMQEKANVSGVLSSVAHLQTETRQKAHSWAGDRGTAPPGNLRPNSQLEVCEKGPVLPGAEEMDSNGTSDYKSRNTDGPLSPSWKKQAIKVSSSGLNKVSELKKIFEV